MQGFPLRPRQNITPWWRVFSCSLVFHSICGSHNNSVALDLSTLSIMDCHLKFLRYDLRFVWDIEHKSRCTRLSQKVLGVEDRGHGLKVWLQEWRPAGRGGAPKKKKSGVEARDVFFCFFVAPPPPPRAPAVPFHSSWENLA